MPRFILVIACLTVLAMDGAAAVPLGPETGDGRALTKEEVEYHPSAGRLSWDQLATWEAWEQPPANTIGTWEPDRTQALRIVVTNDSEHAGNFRLELRWPHLEHVEFGVLRGGGFDPIQVSGTRVATNGTSGTENAVFAFPLAAAETATLYLRVTDPLLLYMPMYIWTERGFEQHTNVRIAIYSIAVGVLLVMVLFHAALYFFTRDTMYLAYGNTVFGILLYLLAITGVGELLVWGSHPWFARNAWPVFSTYSFLAATWFFRVFLELKRFGGWVLKCNTAILAWWFVALAANLLGLKVLGMALTGYGGVLATAAGLAGAVYLWARGSRPARYFCVAWAPVSIVTVLAILAMFGKADYFPGMDYLQSFAFVLEAGILSIALADRINRERRERERAQARALAQEQKLVAVEQRAKEHLEAQVDLRTGELRAALSELAKANRELSGLSRTDPLTQLANRRHFDEAAAAEVLRAIRSGSSLGVILVDLDHFKAVNDQHGHLAGDECLRRTAVAIRSVAARETDLVARFGGEEFAVVLADTPESRLADLAERIRAAIAEIALETESGVLRVTASLGYVSSRPQPDTRLDHLLAAADSALYDAKQAGRNRVTRGRLLTDKELS
ncbi:sensor domain-containing diguanylate cyclase [Gilvimarinus sp. F26214L]|uniref:sensor domain-containing diguanylate cyclase n=1 Tax=Gilvimarinus sp. DZF01 TaxID=3461371 RepID=UPI00404584AE